MKNHLPFAFCKMAQNQARFAFSKIRSLKIWQVAENCEFFSAPETKRIRRVLQYKNNKIKETKRFLIVVQYFWMQIS